MSRLVRSIRDNGADLLSALAAGVYFLGFFGAVHAASGRLWSISPANTLRTAA